MKEVKQIYKFFFGRKIIQAAGVGYSKTMHNPNGK